jgi:serine/threonine protein kinase
VYQAQDPLGSQWAVKLIDLGDQMPADREQVEVKFRREFEITQRLASPYIVRSTDYGQIGEERRFMVMELCAGGNLYHHARAQPLTPTTLRPVVVQVLYGLRDAHAAGIYHRDLKPENILFDQNGVAKIADFGIAADVKARLTRRNWRGLVKEVFGTVAYAPPEQTDHRTAFFVHTTNDLYALGVIMYEMLTHGQFPFGSLEQFTKDPLAYQKRKETGQWNREPLLTRQLPDLWLKLIAGCLQAKPKDRFQQADDLLALLEDRPQTPVPAPENAQKAGAWRLRVKDGDEPERYYHLSNLARHLATPTLRVGWYNLQDPFANEVGITEQHTNYISARHATLTLEHHQHGLQRWSIRDGQHYERHGHLAWHPSLNGVYVNARPLGSDKQFLQHGDIVVLGQTTLRVEVS